MKVFSLLSLVCCAVLTGCGIPDTVKEQDNTTAIEVSADTARTSLDWNGIYKGTVPCSDCEGTQVLLELKQDGTYMQSFSYIGKVSATVMDEGNIAWNTAGNEITINDMRYFVAENHLILLDANTENSDEPKKFILYKEPAM